ncbi:MAG: hypothetical protein MH137_02545 [Flavobacteriales bacterium]|nr:hypothetical protein [Flavobacteriales bacterium]
MCKNIYAQQIIEAPPTRGEVEIEIWKLTEQLQLLENKFIDKTIPFQSNSNIKNKAREEVKLSEYEYTRNKSEILSQITYWENILISIKAAEDMGITVPVERKEEIFHDMYMNPDKKKNKLIVKRIDFDALPVEKRNKILERPDLYEIVN